jgi:hypothetical protein
MCGYSTFKPTCLSRLLAPEELLVFSLLIVSDVNGTWCTCRMMTASNFLLEVRERTKTMDASALGIKSWWRIFETVQDIEFPYKFTEYYWMNIKTSDYIFDSVKDDMQGYYNFRKCIETEKKLTVAPRYVLSIVVKDKNTLHMQNVQCYKNSVQSKGKLHKKKSELHQTEVSYRFPYMNTNIRLLH